MRLYSLVAFLILVAAFLPVVHGQQTLTQPMYQVSWTSKTLRIKVPDSPAWAKAGFQSAAEDWNQAQTWFLKEYEPNHVTAMYTLQIAQAGQGAQVTVQYVANTGQDWDGQTSESGTRISIVISSFYASEDAEIIAEHELGHVLGLGDNKVSHDLETMIDHVGNYPSTLDLYSAYVQAVSGNAYGNGDTIRLPSQIPYLTWHPGMVVPEFPVPTLLLFLVVSVLFILRKRKRSVFS
jgi:hypothetical protein